MPLLVTLNAYHEGQPLQVTGITKKLAKRSFHFYSASGYNLRMKFRFNNHYIYNNYKVTMDLNGSPVKLSRKTKP